MARDPATPAAPATPATPARPADLETGNVDTDVVPPDAQERHELQDQVRRWRQGERDRTRAETRGRLRGRLHMVDDDPALPTASDGPQPIA